MSDESPQRFLFFFGGGQADGGNESKPLVGGKGASLAEMTRAGLNVPPGFTVSSRCCQAYFERGGQWPDGLHEEIRRGIAWLEQKSETQFGRGEKLLLVAVRSGAAESMPGMMDTVLNVGSRTDDPYQELFQAVEAVFRSWNSERAIAYREHHNIRDLPGTAVNVQMMCPSEVSGVLFTAHPVDPDRKQMVLEWWYGLGEAVVLGKVMPHRLVLDRSSGSIVEREMRDECNDAALTEPQVRELAALGRRVEEYFGHPCDIEWGLTDGKFYLLQARPIQRQKTAAAAEELERVRQEEMARLKALAAPEGTVWSRYNLYEILPQPTPMTWSIVQKLNSGHGGFGLMYRDLGFDPDPSLDELGIFDLVCGRPYVNLSREPKQYFRQFPFEHPFDALKKDPSKALNPQPKLNIARAGWKFWLLLPFIFIKQLRANSKLVHSTRTFAKDFRDRIVPAFVNETLQEAQLDFAELEPDALLERLKYWIQRTLVDFARDSLKPTALADNVQNQVLVALTRLDTATGKDAAAQATQDQPQARLGKLIMGVHPDTDADLPGAIRQLAADTLDHETFLQKFGHRGHNEMELAQPRWSEDPHELDQLLKKQTQKEEVTITESPATTVSPLAEYTLSESQRAALENQVQLLQTYVALRETGKHHLMRGYALIRRLLVELDKRCRLDGGIFFLTLEELPALVRGEDLRRRIAERRRQRELLLKLQVPPVLFSDDLDAIGRAVPPTATKDSYQGIPLSAGVAQGPALVLHELPENVPGGEPYILVCPSTDPAWMPLFVRARALIMETGGMLSHGAIVAREFGLPAVAGLPNIHQLLHTGQLLHVDGGTGRVTVLE
jgi:pyruvate,water dikinase